MFKYFEFWPKFTNLSFFGRFLFLFASWFPFCHFVSFVAQIPLDWNFIDISTNTWKRKFWCLSILYRNKYCLLRHSVSVSNIAPANPATKNVKEKYYMVIRWLAPIFYMYLKIGQQSAWYQTRQCFLHSKSSWWEQKYRSSLLHFLK